VANSRSARKRIRANERKHLRNRGVRSSVRTKVGKARRALVGLDETIDSAAQLAVAVSALDRASEKGILHRKNAARRKSRLMALANRLEIAAAAGEDALAAARAQALGGEKGRKTAGGRARAAAAAAVAAEVDESGIAGDGETAAQATAPKRRGTKAAPAAAAAASAKAAPAKATRAKAAPKAAGGTSAKGPAKS
jgi:small subunit ribosomal protein S20